ncbi:mucosal addressin cell adhesion molecule 1-like isoform X2 [Alosa sapidissima]|uniref:mucosal addressin cell adhesion molecule 1-like isoform X2 n=1 Tax=Alosa sapidissima TaxID=34773 RepID=UPI001C0901F8|nr:mucosal addressin cell adhesion molecule 1-like isoform X2 [Alosa sapidissima]
MALQQQHHILLQCLPLVLLGTSLHAHTVRVQPSQLFVELGSAFNLSCSTDCPGGHASWVTQDDSDFTTTEDRQGVVLSVLSTHEYHAGDYVCISQCKQQHKKASARLNVFSFPDPVLSMAPLNPVSGQSVQVNCTVSVYCSDNYEVDIKLFGEDELSGPMYKFCDESNICNHMLSATDRRGGERVHYTCSAEFTVSMRTIKTANMTIQFQDIRVVDSTQYTTPTMASLTSSAAISVESITETSPGKNAIGTEPNHPDTTPDSVSSGQTTSSESMTRSPRGEGSTSLNHDYREDPNAMKAVEPVSRLTTSIIGTTGALLFSAMGIVIYAYKYGRKLPCLGSSRRKENADELKEVS